jgi:predicted Rossmann fold flavoprotein
MIYDVAVLGAGAAGLFAAIRAAERGRSVIVLEKNRRPGVKILMSGGTRCNLTNARGLRNLRLVSGPIDPAYDPRESRGARSIQAAFGENGSFLGPSLKAFGVESTVSFFETEGVATKVEGNGKIFPATDRASDVLAALTGRLGRTGAKLLLNSPCLGVEATDEGFRVRVPEGEVAANRVIVAVGGLSYPGCGTTGDGFAIARHFGHHIVEPRPALVPLRVDASWATDLRGLTLPDARATISDAGGTTLLERREAVLFAHFGLTGPAILDVSRAVARHNGSGCLMLRIDLVPETKAETLDATLQSASRSGRGQVVGMLPDTIPRRLAEAVLSAADLPAGRIGPELSRDERKRLVTTIKALGLPVAGTLGFGKAEVTSGGVALDEVRPETLESLRQPGLHFIGEVLDLDGLIGGYNFQAAWSTGWLAGESV